MPSFYIEWQFQQQKVFQNAKRGLLLAVKTHDDIQNLEKTQ